MEWIVPAWLGFLFFWLFVLGCAVGSFLNVVVYRVPRSKSVVWPSSRCGHCLKAIPSGDNVPLWGYLRLRGRCRACGFGFSMRYFWFEFFTGVVFAVLYAVEIGWNIHGVREWGQGGFWYLQAGTFAPSSWVYFVGHAALASLLLVAVACLLGGEMVPRSVALTGAVGGIAWQLLAAWTPPADAPGWLSGLAGLFVGWAIVRGVNAALEKPVLDASLVLLAGGFLGWKIVAVALAVSAGFLFLGQRAFSLALACGFVAAWLGWPWLRPILDPWFESWAAAPGLGLLAVVLFAAGAIKGRPW